MTNNILEEGAQNNAQVAAMTAVSLVRQVLDDAYIIASAAVESGQPWRYVSMINGLQYLHITETASENVVVEPRMNDPGKAEDDEIELYATSTPQKSTDLNKPEKDNNDIIDLIGQGDENIELEQSDIFDSDPNSHSMLINNLFDMSYVEPETEICELHIEGIVNNSDDITKIMESYVDEALNVAFKEDGYIEIPEQDKTSLSNTSFSANSFITDAQVEYVVTDYIFSNTDNVPLMCENKEDASSSRQYLTTQEIYENIQINENAQMAIYESAYLTLNRDEQDDDNNDDEVETLLQDSRTPFHEIRLLTANSSQESLRTKVKENVVTDDSCKDKGDDIPSTTGKLRKMTLARRCRKQGAKILSCLRGWWRRRTYHKKQAYHVPRIGSPCPLSPSTRKRTVSLLDHRQLGDMPEEQCMLWKFNTVNESVVNSSHWKEYTFEDNVVPILTV